jgi:hypothetical protein
LMAATWSSCSPKFSPRPTNQATATEPATRGRRGPVAASRHVPSTTTKPSVNSGTIPA